MKVTANERSLLIAICVNEFHDGRHPVGDEVWVDCINGWADNKNYGGVMKSLVSKKLAVTNGTTCYVTQAGYDLVKEDVE
jgi:hypothetical protein